MSREQDRLFIRNFMAVLAALVGVTVALIIAVNIAFDQDTQGPTAVERERAARHLQPAGRVQVAPPKAQAPQPAADPGADAGTTPAPEAAAAQSAESGAAPAGQDTAGDASQTQPQAAAEPAAVGAGSRGTDTEADGAPPAEPPQASAEAQAADTGGAEGTDQPEVAAAEAANGGGGAAGAQATAEPEAGGATSPPPPAEDLSAGQVLAEGMCYVCHNNRFLNSPQIGDRTAWKPRLGQDLATMVRHVQEGYGNMPPQGAFGTDEEIRKAILWMVEKETGLEVKR